MKQSTQNVPCSVDLQEACPPARLCSWTSIADVTHTKYVYVIVDEQSNSSLVTSELADDLGADGPLEKYFLSTCSGEKEEKYRRRVAGIVVCSLSGAKFTVLALTECDTIPQDKSEIPTPGMAPKAPEGHSAQNTSHKRDSQDSPATPWLDHQWSDVP